MKTFILASLLAVTAVSGAVMLSDPAKADFNYYSNGLFGHTYSPMPIYNPVLPLAGAGAAPAAGGFDANDDGGGSMTDDAGADNAYEDQDNAGGDCD